MQGSNFSSFLIPYVFNSQWNVCLEHLVQDPISCSAHVIMENHEQIPELFLNGNLATQFDMSLIRRVEPFLSLIPKNPRHICDFRFCENCKHPVVRSFFSVTERNLEDSEDDTIIHIFCHRCPCLKGWYVNKILTSCICVMARL